MDRDVRKLHHNKQDVAVIKVGVPSNDELVEGVTQLRYVSGSGLFWYLKYNNTVYRQQFAGPNQQQVITTSISPSGEPAGSDHGELDGLADDDHTQYLLISGTRAMTGDLSLSGGDGALTFTVAGENSIKIPDNQASALIIEEANAAYLTFVTTNSGEKITLGKKLEAGSVEIEGSAFDINGGTIDGATIGASSHSTIKGTTIDATTDFTIGGTVMTANQLVMLPSIDDTVTISAASNGALNIVTVDTAGAAGHITITADGDLSLKAAGARPGIVIDGTSRSIYINEYDTSYGTIITHGATTVAANYAEYRLQVLGDTYFYTQGQGDFKQNYSMISSHEEVASGVTYPGE